MANPYLGEVRIVGFNFAPSGWAFCNGQLLPISQNSALFSILGTNFGGNGTSTFGLPNFQGSMPVGQGTGPGLSQYHVGQSGGTPSVTVLSTEMASHSHTVGCDTAAGGSLSPAGQVWAAGVKGAKSFNSTGPGTLSMHPQAFSLAGGSQSHNNIPPYLVLNFVIALQGVFPTRS
jgi:microcystin-dependent protein